MPTPAKLKKYIAQEDSKKIMKETTSRSQATWKIYNRKDFSEEFKKQ